MQFEVVRSTVDRRLTINRPRTGVKDGLLEKSPSVSRSHCQLCRN